MKGLKNMKDENIDKPGLIFYFMRFMIFMVSQSVGYGPVLRDAQ